MENISGPVIAFFLATSGHSGVDRVMKNLITEIAGRGIHIDLLRISRHGPHFKSVPENVRLVELGTSHVNTSFLPLVRYLRHVRPSALLSDKDRVNRVALWARRIAGVDTRVAVRMGTTVSENLAKRGWLDRKLQYFSIRRFYPWADAVLVPSQGAAEDLVRIGGLNPARVRVVPSPIVNDRLYRMAEEDPGHPWLVDASVPIVLGVGELCERKDFATLLKAFALLRKKRPARLIILGEGRKRESLLELAAQLGVAGDFDLPGFQANPYAFMARASLFALTSRCEGAPVVLMEALACGTPVVSTDCRSGPREILQGGRLGPLVPVGDFSALAREMEERLDVAEPRELLREGAEPYRVSNSANRYLEALGVFHGGQ
jgi:glycosyltransferase involved in cell wall biosynthesis